MKKLLAISLALVMVMSLAACGKEKEPVEEPVTPPVEEEVKNEVTAYVTDEAELAGMTNVDVVAHTYFYLPTEDYTNSVSLEEHMKNVGISTEAVTTDVPQAAPVTTVAPAGGAPVEAKIAPEAGSTAPATENPAVPEANADTAPIEATPDEATPVEGIVDRPYVGNTAEKFTMNGGTGRNYFVAVANSENTDNLVISSLTDAQIVNSVSGLLGAVVPMVDENAVVGSTATPSTEVGSTATVAGSTATVAGSTEIGSTAVPKAEAPVDGDEAVANEDGILPIDETADTTDAPANANETPVTTGAPATLGVVVTGTVVADATKSIVTFEYTTTEDDVTGLAAGTKLTGYATLVIVDNVLTVAAVGHDEAYTNNEWCLKMIQSVVIDVNNPGAFAAAPVAGSTPAVGSTAPVDGSTTPVAGSTPAVGSNPAPVTSGTPAVGSAIAPAAGSTTTAADGAR